MPPRDTPDSRKSLDLRSILAASGSALQICSVRAEGEIWRGSGVDAVRRQQVFVEDAEAVAACIFHRVHGCVSIAEEFLGGAPAFGKDGDTDAEGQADFLAADLNWLRGVANNLPTAALNILHGAEFGHHDNKLVSTHASHGVALAHGGEQALPYSGEENVAVGVAERIINLLEVVDVKEENRRLLTVVLRVEDRMTQTLVEEHAVGEASQVVVMCEIVDVIGAAAVLRDVAAGDGDPGAESDNLDVEPGGFYHLVVDEDFTCVGNPAADDFTVFVDEAGFDHERPNLGEDFAVKGFAGYAQPTLGVRVDVTEAEVDDGSGGIGDAVEDVEVVQCAFGSGEESGVVRCGGCVCPLKALRKKGVEKGEAPAPETFRAHTQLSDPLTRYRLGYPEQLYRRPPVEHPSSALEAA